MADESGDKLSKLYDVLSKDKKYKFSGDADAFAQRFSDPEKLGKLYDVLAKDPKYKIATKKDEWVSQFNQGLKKKESSESSGQSGTSASQTTSPNNPNGLSLPDIGKVVSEYKEHPLPLSPDQIQQKYITDAEKENDVTKLQQQAYQHATTKNYAASNAIADIIQQKDPKNAYANTLKGNNLLHDGKPALAENEFTQALKKNPTDPDHLHRSIHHAPRQQQHLDRCQHLRQRHHHQPLLHHRLQYEPLRAEHDACQRHLDLLRKLLSPTHRRGQTPNSLVPLLIQRLDLQCKLLSATHRPRQLITLQN